MRLNAKSVLEIVRLRIKKTTHARSFYPKRYLRFESLEDRRLMANLELDIQLWSIGADGDKGTRILPNPANSQTFQLNLNDSFLVQILADDVSTAGETNRPSAGIVSLPLDVKWNTANVTGPSSGQTQYSGVVPRIFGQGNIELDRENKKISTKVLSNVFDTVRFVNSFDVVAGAGQLRGVSLASQIGKACSPSSDRKDGCGEFSLMQFTATKVGTSNFQVDSNGSMSFADGARLDNIPNAMATIVIAATPPTNSSLSGFVYADTNQDVIRTLNTNGAPLEIGIPNVTISLFVQGTATAINTTTTGPDGWYHFENLLEGVYRIVQTQPPGFRSTGNTLGVVLPGSQRIGVVGTDEISGINLSPGQHGVNYDFGEILSSSGLNKRMLLSSTPLMEVLIAKQLGVTATSIQGTDGDDTIMVSNNNGSIQVSVNSQPVQIFGNGRFQSLIIDSGAGNDTVTIQGTSNEERVLFQPTYVGLRREDVSLANPAGYGVVAKNSEHVNVVAGVNQTGLAVFQDSPSSDLVMAGGANAAISWASNLASAQTQSFKRIRLISTLGGTDKVTEQPRDLTIERFGNWT